MDIPICAMYSRRNLTPWSIQSTHHVFLSQQKIPRQPICWKNLPVHTGWAQKSAKKTSSECRATRRLSAHGIHGGEGRCTEWRSLQLVVHGAPPLFLQLGWHHPWNSFSGWLPSLSTRIHRLSDGSFGGFQIEGS